MADRVPLPAIICPLASASYFESAVSLILESGFERSLPLQDRTYKLAAAAVGFGLRVGCDYPEELDSLLPSAPDAGYEGCIAEQADAFLASFTSPCMQEGLVVAAQQAGAPLLAVLVMLLVHHARQNCPATTTDDGRESAHALTCLFLLCVLLLARDHPEIARMFRNLVPA